MRWPKSLALNFRKRLKIGRLGSTRVAFTRKAAQGIGRIWGGAPGPDGRLEARADSCFTGRGSFELGWGSLSCAGPWVGVVGFVSSRQGRECRTSGVRFLT